MAREALSYCADQVRRYDRDRFLTALFAPADAREDLFALYAFNLEVAKIRETVTEPMLGRIRLQWWRETLAGIAQGVVRPHAVAEPLAAAIHRHQLPLGPFETLIDGREQDLEPDPPADLDALQTYAEQTAGRLVGLASRILGGGEAAQRAANHVGIAHGLAGLLLAVPYRASYGRVDLPRDLLDEAGLHPTTVKEARGDRRLSAIMRVVALRAGEHVAAARREHRAVPRRAIAALLPVRLAERALKRLAAADYDPFEPRLARPGGTLPLGLALAAWRGRY